MGSVWIAFGRRSRRWGIRMSGTTDLGLGGVLSADRVAALRARAERMERTGEVLGHGDF
jgi:hypothetical protein